MREQPSRHLIQVEALLHGAHLGLVTHHALETRHLFSILVEFLLFLCARDAKTR